MKLRLLSVVLLIALALTCFAACGSETPDENLISEEKALAVVLDDTGLVLESLTNLTSELVRETDSVFYRISFTADNLPYTYTVDAETGAILSYPEF